ncbi:M15 family metallopeptidase [Gordonia sp. (in: high G+C Gram-positive bacteria)]|uniref:M15 family metallopeptidase n=1 Tax=Gordonia sp. (in: high G+C Gram-positive bacteria) TaxID=84139 RepID=UPI003F99FBFB
MSFRTVYGYAWSENGWRMCNADETVVVRIAEMPLRVRSGYAAEALGAWARWYHTNVEPIDNYQPLDDWGWSATNDVANSNHLSGTAVDLNATQYPWGARTMPADRIARIRRGLQLFEGVIFWGADWGRADEMHYQLNTGTAHITGASDRLADFCRRRIHNGQLVQGDDDMSNADITKIESFIKAYLGPNNSDTKDVRQQLTGSRDLVYVSDPHSGKRVIDLDASYRGFRQSGGRTLMDLTCAIAARVGVPNTYDTSAPR